MDELSDGLQKLAGKVKGRRQSVVTQKQSDWQTVQERHPDVAAHITEFSSVFGKPALLRVTDNSGDVLLDSLRYE